MKHLQKLLLAICTLSFAASYAQGDTTLDFYDYWWKKGDKDISHYYRIKYREGKWWHTKDYYIAQNTLQKEVTYSDDSLQVQQGMCYYFHPNGRLQKKVRYGDGKKEGIVKEYNEDGRLIDSGLYKSDIPYKAHYKWDDEGHVIFKGIYDENGYGVGEETKYFPDGKISMHGITKEGYKRDSIWTYYRNNGIVSCQDYYDNGNRAGRMCYDENGTQYQGSCEDAPAQFAEKGSVISNRFGQRYADLKESNYKINEQSGSLSGTLDASYKFKKGAYIVFRIYVDEKGKMTKVETVHKIHPQVDDMLANILKGISKFIPAMDGNRQVKASFDYPFPLDQL